MYLRLNPYAVRGPYLGHPEKVLKRDNGNILGG